jgi:hypothetical protein
MKMGKLLRTMQSWWYDHHELMVSSQESAQDDICTKDGDPAR